MIVLVNKTKLHTKKEDATYNAVMYCQSKYGLQETNTIHPKIFFKYLGEDRVLL